MSYFIEIVSSETVGEPPTNFLILYTENMYKFLHMTWYIFIEIVDQNSSFHNVFMKQH
jgi:hypothetical protein